MSKSNTVRKIRHHWYELNKIDLWREMSQDQENQWLITKSPFAQHFLASVRLQESKRLRRDYFFSSRGLDSSAITIEGVEFYWTQAKFNERDSLVQSMLTKNPNTTNAQIIAKFKKITVDETFLTAKSEAENYRERKKTESAARSVNIFFIVLAIIFLFLLKSCIDVFNSPPADSQFMNACKSRPMTTEAECKATEKRNKKFGKEMDERF